MAYFEIDCASVICRSPYSDLEDSYTDFLIRKCMGRYINFGRSSHAPIPKRIENADACKSYASGMARLNDKIAGRPYSHVYEVTAQTWSHNVSRLSVRCA